MSQLRKYYDITNVSFEEVKASESKYNSKWPYQFVTIDYSGIVVEKVIWDGDTTYMVSVPFIIKKQKNKNGKVIASKGVTIAYVQPSTHIGSGKPDYFIGSIWYVPKS